MTTSTIACLQTRPKPDTDQAIEEAVSVADRASTEASMLLLPEYCSGFRVVNGAFAPPAEAEESSRFLQAMRNLAARRNCWIMLGSVAIRPEAQAPAENGRFCNRGYIIDNDGNIVSRYDKIHLFDIQLSETEVYRESDIVLPGDALSLVDTPVGTIGHTICYDLRFPNLYRDLAQAGAEILAIPAAFTRTTGEAHWHALCRARAIENGAWVIAPCATGDIDGGGGSYGHSLVVDPWGRIVADGGTDRQALHAHLDLSEVASARRKIPSLQHDRPWRDAHGAADAVA